MRTDEILTQINETLTNWYQHVDSFYQEEINVVPFEGSWTAGQVAQHLILGNGGFEKLVNGPVKETERAPDQNVEKIKEIFLNFSTKLKSPDFIIPADTNYIKDDLLRSIEDIKARFIKDIETLDLTKTCIAFELPGGGGFATRWEAIHLVLYHTQRHNHQLEKISQKIMSRDNAV